jgi:hypothetical protein
MAIIGPAEYSVSSDEPQLGEAVMSIRRQARRSGGLPRRQFGSPCPDGPEAVCQLTEASYRTGRHARPNETTPMMPATLR